MHYAAPPIIGGVESTIFHHSRLLSQHGYKVEVIAGRGSAFQERVKFHLVPEFDSRHPKVLEIGQELAKGKVSEKFTTLKEKFFQDLNTLLGDSTFCIVHNILTLHKNLPLTAALFEYNKQSKVQLIAWCHDFAWKDKLYTEDLHPGYPWDLLRVPWPKVRYVTVSSHRQKNLAELLGLPSEDIEVIPPGIDLERFFKLEQTTRQLLGDFKLLDAEPLLLLPARITRRKNIEFALNMIAELKKDFPEVLLIVTGPPGPHNPKNLLYLEQLHAELKRLGIEKNVRFLYDWASEGNNTVISDEVIADLYMLADGLLFPSFREGFGIPILEAALARNEIFAADIPPVRESSTGLVTLFDPHGDPHDASRMLCGAFTQSRIYQLRKHVIHHYTWQSIVSRKIIPLFLEVKVG